MGNDLPTGKIVSGPAPNPFVKRQYRRRFRRKRQNSNYYLMCDKMKRLAEFILETNYPSLA